MKKVLLALLITMGVFAGEHKTVQLTDEQVTDVISNTNDGMVINFADVCSLFGCRFGITLKYKDLIDVSLQLTSLNDSDDHLRFDNDGYMEICDWSQCGERPVGNVIISSNLPIKQVTTGAGAKLVGRATIVRDTSNRASRVHTIKRGTKTVTLDLSSKKYATLKSITIEASMAGFKGYYQAAKAPLLASLKMIKNETLYFQKHMSKSDRNLDHFERFIVSLDDGMAILNDKKDYSVLDWRVQEGMRRVVSFGMIISDVLWAYEDVPSVLRNIDNIRRFRDELRATYGWDETLAGNVSKTTGAIFELMHYEIKQIWMIKEELGPTGNVYRNILSGIRKLIAMVNARDGGDIIVGQNISIFMNAWNDSAWQAELADLMQAKLDLRKLVRPKLKYILNSVMALEELIDQRRVYFDVDVIGDAVNATPEKGLQAN